MLTREEASEDHTSSKLLNPPKLRYVPFSLTVYSLVLTQGLLDPWLSVQEQHDNLKLTEVLRASRAYTPG